MQWLNNIVDELIKLHPEGEIVVSSGVSPSGTYHLGTFREVLTAEAIHREVKRRGRDSRHIHVSDDLDVFRKVPVGIPEDFKRYLGKPLCDVPAPDGSDKSYADYYVADLYAAAAIMHLDLEVIRAHEKYRSGYFVDVIETTLDQADTIKEILESISGHKVDNQWSPIQVVEDGYLKNRQFISLNKEDKTLVFKDGEGKDRTISYAHGEVKLNWRIDWPARWSLLGVDAEPFGRDHATKGGSYDTGAVISQKVFNTVPPLPLPYDFINRTGATKKMSKSSGDTVTATQLLEVLPPEVVWFFILRYQPSKQLFFDEGETLIRLVDSFSELLAKPDKTEADQQLIDLCLQGIDQPTVSRVPFSHLVASYQAALRDVPKTLETIARTEYKEIVKEDAEIIKAELKFIDAWLEKHAPEEVTFSLQDKVDMSQLSDTEVTFLKGLAESVSKAPEDADGAWFHQAIYEFKDSSGLTPKELFSTLYKVLIGKDSGPRAGWFLSILPRDWLIKRLRLES
ncbi:MAG TPA: lysine--tRNA ligase [Methylomirabilota bacterium]|nr:lysine--tRNA ligase [Methylomirabilota bacterium]